MTTPLAPRPDVLDFLLTRRSRPAKTLSTDAPDRETLQTLLTAASRTPDHGKLAPWRFVVVPRERMEAVATLATEHLTADGFAPDQIEKAARNFTFGGTMIAVLQVPRASEKIPEWEQEAAAATVCLALVNAALASGWGANWLSGPLARHAAFLGAAFDTGPGETAAGFIHLGRETVVPADRDRPDVDAITTWL